MKKILFTAVCFLLVAFAFAQIQDPVKFTYKATKKADKTYEVVISAKVPKPWHIYSQHTPDGGPVATTITFKKNPLVTLSGAIKEVGALKVENDPIFGVQVKYYADKVNFVQTVKLKSKTKTNLAGTIEYMVCDDSQCLPPTTKTFSIKLM